MKKYFFTFGSNHFGLPGTPMEGKTLFRYYVTIEAENEMTARQTMFARYKDKWSFSYNEDQFESSIAKYHLTELERIIQDQPVKSA